MQSTEKKTTALQTLTMFKDKYAVGSLDKSVKMRDTSM